MPIPNSNVFGMPRRRMHARGYRSAFSGGVFRMPPAASLLEPLAVRPLLRRGAIWLLTDDAARAD